MDVAGWLGIDQRRVETQRLPRADVLHSQVTDVEFEGRLVRSRSIDDELCTRANKAVYSYAHFSASTPQVTHFATIVFRRDINGKAADVDCVDLHRFTEQAAQRS